jgi:hypothetical protein
LSTIPHLEAVELGLDEKCPLLTNAITSTSTGSSSKATTSTSSALPHTTAAGPGRTFPILE